MNKLSITLLSSFLKLTLSLGSLLYFTGATNAQDNDALTIDSAGNVGIGLTKPLYKFHILGGAQMGGIRNSGFAFDDNQNPRFGFISQNGSVPRFTVTKRADIVFGHTDQDQVMKNIETGGFTERFRIDSNSGVTIASENGQGILIGKYNDKMSNGGSYSIKFAGYRDVTPNVVTAKISAIRSSICCGGNIAWLAQGAELAFYTTEQVDNANADNSKERMRIKDNGYIGIGESNPDMPLVVRNKKNKQLSYYVLEFPGNIMSRTLERNRQSGQQEISIETEGGISSSGFYDRSDIRIKKDLHFTDSKTDLDLVKKIQVTNFYYKDQVAFGGQIKKGFIAQQVESVFPQAVVKTWGFLPNIYACPEKATQVGSELYISMQLPHQLSTGETVKIITANEEQQLIATVKDAYTFSVGLVLDDQKNIFVYGKKVDDLRTVNYDAIYTLGISSIQELSRQIDQLKEENQQLKKSIDNAQSSLIKRVEMLEIKAGIPNEANGLVKK
jgi:type 1 fimbria pilin